LTPLLQLNWRRTKNIVTGDASIGSNTSYNRLQRRRDMAEDDVSVKEDVAMPIK
jgi:hypothetical protein